MNKVIISGRIIDNAKVNGESRNVVKFKVLARSGWNKKENCPHMDFVPCVLFNPTQKLASLLEEKGKGLHIEFEGRVCRSMYKVKDEKRFSTEVIVYSQSLTFIDD